MSVWDEGGLQGVEMLSGLWLRLEFGLVFKF